MTAVEATLSGDKVASPTQGNLDLLLDRTNWLEGLLDSLESALAEALKPEGDVPISELKTVDVPASILALRIDALSARCRRLQRIIERIDL